MRTTRLYTVYVVLAHVHKAGRIVPETKIYTAFGIDWRPLVVGTPGALVVWSVERTTSFQARDMVLAHLAGHAPSGVIELWNCKWPMPDNALPEH